MEDDFSVEKPKIARLTGPNYRPWSVQVQRLLVSQSLWTVVSLGVETPETRTTSGLQSPPRDSAEPEAAEVLVVIEPKGPRTPIKDAKASTLIMSLCSQNTLQHILLLATAKEQWEALKSLYQPLGLQQLGAKIRAFTTYQPPERGTVAEIATQLSTLQYEIGAINPTERPSDTLKISILFQAIKALDTRFNPLILQLEITGTATDFSVIVTHLTEFERRLGPKEPLKESVFRATQSPNQGDSAAQGRRNKGQKRKFKGNCYTCQKPGHKSAECRLRAPEGSPQGPSTGPLATPSGGRGLSPPPPVQANTATEACWSATIRPIKRAGLLWVIDSGCSRHMTFDREAFTEYRLLEEPIQVQTASGASIQGIATGNATLKIALNGAIRTVQLTNTLHVPELAGSLVSVSQLQDRGITVRTTPGTKGQCLLELQGTIIGAADRIGRAYALNNTLEGPILGDQALKASTKDTEAQLWHKRFGHLSLATLQGVDKATTGLNTPLQGNQEPCGTCNLTKSVRVINRISPEHCTEPLQRIHTDMWGPYSVPSLYGNHYVTTFTDDYTRKSWIYCTKDRAELFTIFVQFKTLVELESGHRIKTIRCDNASEYKSLGDRISRIYGLQFEYTTVYTPEQNGVAERLNRTLVQLARGMLLGSGLPIRFWEDAITTACYLRNRAPIGPKRATPEEAYSGKKPYIGHLRVFGCRAYAHIPKETRNKLEPNAVVTCLVGYMRTSRQYKLYDPIKGRIIVATAPVFSEEETLEVEQGNQQPGDLVTPFDPIRADKVPENRESLEAPAQPLVHTRTPENSTIIVDNTEALSPSKDPELGAEHSNIEDTSSGDLITKSSAPEPEEPPPRRGDRVRRPPQRYEAFSATESIKIPRTYAEALADPVHRGYWQQAISEELTKLQALGTWEYAELPSGKKAVGCKWVFTVKYTPTGLVDHYKARLVAQGYSQVPGDDYLETFSPTIRAESLRILLAIGAIEDLEIRQVDVVSAYPRSRLHATVYMKPPEALRAPKNKVLLLNNSLYGLKQSGREWYIEACKGLKTLGLTPCYSDPSVFISVDKSLILGLYVDDMLVLGARLEDVQNMIQGISKLWEIKDLGDVGRILGLQVQRDRPNRTLKIDQSHYIQEVLERFRLQDAKPINLPVTDRNTLIVGQSTEELADQSLYQQAIGSLIWIAKGTRFDIQYATGQLSQYCNCPTIRHWNAVLRVLRYLKGTLKYSLKLGPEGQIQGYSDADYAGDTTNRRSVSGQLYLLGSGPVTWSSLKQRCVATSTTESEYIALSEATKQGQWIRALLRELQRTQYLPSTLAIPVFSDNQSCIALAKDPIAHSRTKHIEVRYHYIRELVSYGKTTIDYIPSGDMVADILTKPLPAIAFNRCIRGLLG
jgi:Reverse transcriptase (RNA-dependent DNA polymerase)/Integrase core domain/GAG-pre-integrase domain